MADNGNQTNFKGFGADPAHNQSLDFLVFSNLASLETTSQITPPEISSSLSSFTMSSWHMIPPHFLSTNSPLVTSLQPYKLQRSTTKQWDTTASLP